MTNTTRDLTGFTKLARIQDIPEGESRVFEFEDESVALCNAGGSFYAINNLCTHDNGPLGDGCLNGFEVVCPRHGARFDIRTGGATAMPAVVGVDSFETVVDGEDIYVKLDF